MPKINFNQAKEILEKISENDNVAIIHHDDGDGFCAGILYLEYCKSKGAKTKHFTYSIGKSKIHNFDLEEFNKIIITDIASELATKELFEIDKNKEIIFLDHHPEKGEFAKNTSYLITTDDGYIPASRTAGELTNGNKLLALTGTITDMGFMYEENEEFINKNLELYKITLEDFRRKVSSTISNAICYLDKNHEKTFQEILKIKTIEDAKKLEEYAEPVEQEIQFFIEDYKKNHKKLGNINFYTLNPKFNTKGIIINMISQHEDKEQYIFASFKKNENKITLSARSNSDEHNMPELLKAGINGLEKSNAGGHIRAAGGSIQMQDLEKFKQNIRSYLENKNETLPPIKAKIN